MWRLQDCNAAFQKTKEAAEAESFICQLDLSHLNLCLISGNEPEWELYYKKGLPLSYWVLD